jgi:hypothetical protein
MWEDSPLSRGQWYYFPPFLQGSVVANSPQFTTWDWAKCRPLKSKVIAELIFTTHNLHWDWAFLVLDIMLLKDYKRWSGHWEQVKLTTTGHLEYTVMILSHQHHKIPALSLKLKKGLPLMQLVRPTVPPCHFRCAASCLWHHIVGWKLGIVCTLMLTDLLISFDNV